MTAPIANSQAKQPDKPCEECAVYRSARYRRTILHWRVGLGLRLAVSALALSGAAYVIIWDLAELRRIWPGAP